MRILKPTIDRRMLLRERLEKANSRSTELKSEEKKRLAKLEDIAVKLKRVKSSIQTWLTEDKYALIEVEWE
jgi:hypothetical protein